MVELGKESRLRALDAEDLNRYTNFFIDLGRMVTAIRLGDMKEVDRYFCSVSETCEYFSAKDTRDGGSIGEDLGATLDLVFDDLNLDGGDC